MSALSAADPSPLPDPSAVSEVAQRLATDHPGIDAEMVEAMLLAELERTSQATVQQFRLVLAERHVRAALRSHAPVVSERGDRSAGGGKVAADPTHQPRARGEEAGHVTPSRPRPGAGQVAGGRR